MPAISTSPEWTPARIDRPSARARLRIAIAASIAPTGAVEGHEEAVPGRVHLAAAVTVDDDAHRAVVTGQELRPRAVTEGDGPLRRPDDVREEEGQQDSAPGTLRDPGVKACPVDRDERNVTAAQPS